MNKFFSIFCFFFVVVTFSTKVREKARGQLWQNSGLRGQNCVLHWAQGKIVSIHARGGGNLRPLHLISPFI